ncbi:Signal transduction histidine kinase [Ekhidna lutea]|uniref:histidine kinase n=1 Tax=Ekhidna lutea TaxID=447679 RepID=A0A239KJ78_EKHLU|nr:HAMP domain-containing sensor histidine kinase [Ekhidna lutea]SNT17778.1 Signal transduction histidine kinase [Ekhidna lutea]
MASDNPIEALQERIKELTCLYEISNIAVDGSLSLEDQLQSIVNYLPRAWKHQDEGIAEITLDDKQYTSGQLQNESISQHSPLVVEDKKRGYLAMHYDAANHDQSSFLSEEQKLLKTLAQEVAGIVQRNEQKERELLLNSRLQHSDRLAILGEITAGIAHELNTPLGNILGFSQLIQERNKDNQIDQDVEKIISSVMHSREIVKKLMFFSCEMPQQMSIVSINKLVEEALNLLKITLRNANISVDFSSTQDNIDAHVDPVQYTQVVFNLLINAIHASNPEKVILIKLEADSNSCRLSITDQGHGIEDAIRDKIFEPFFSTKPKGEGSGLGLSVVHGIVKSHKGSIQVNSRVNEGTTFIVDIPLRQEQ